MKLGNRLPTSAGVASSRHFVRSIAQRAHQLHGLGDIAFIHGAIVAALAFRRRNSPADLPPISDNLRRRQPRLPGVPTGTCTPNQLHGVKVRHAIHAHCCSGVSGFGPAHGGVSGPPHIGSADADAGRTLAPMATAMAAPPGDRLVLYNSATQSASAISLCDSYFRRSDALVVFRSSALNSSIAVLSVVMMMPS